jgi:hypothetical protein
MSAEHFRTNSPHIIHEVIEGEAVLINLESGAYYSTAQAGAAIWDAIDKGLSVSQIAALLNEEYAGDSETIRAGVAALVADLQQEGLVVPLETPPDAATFVSAPPRSDRPPFVAPVLRKYTEMSELLQLDPIHDVDDSGWPNQYTENDPHN